MDSSVKAGPAVRFWGGTEIVFFKKLWGLWPGLSRAQAVSLEAGGSLKETHAWVWAAHWQVWELVVGSWLGLLQEPVCQHPAVLPSSWALSLLYEVQVILRLLQVPDLRYQPGGSCTASGKVDGFDPGRALYLWRGGFCLQSRDGKVLCRAPRECSPRLQE